MKAAYVEVTHHHMACLGWRKTHYLSASQSAENVRPNLSASVNFSAIVLLPTLTLRSTSHPASCRIFFKPTEASVFSSLYNKLGRCIGTFTYALPASSMPLDSPALVFFFDWNGFLWSLPTPPTYSFLWYAYFFLFLWSKHRKFKWIWNSTQYSSSNNSHHRSCNSYPIDAFLNRMRSNPDNLLVKLWELRRVHLARSYSRCNSMRYHFHQEPNNSSSCLNNSSCRLVGTPVHKCSLQALSTVFFECPQTRRSSSH